MSRCTELPQPRVTLVSLASDGSPGEPQAQGRPHGWVHARELSTLVVTMKYYRTNVLREGSVKVPEERRAGASIYGCKDD